MIWNLPFSARFILIFVFVPLIDTLSKCAFDYPLISIAVKSQLEYFARFCYLYGWFLIGKTFSIVVGVSLIKLFSNYQWYDDNILIDISWFATMLWPFILAYVSSLIHSYMRDRLYWLSKIIAIVGLLVGISYNLYTLYETSLIVDPIIDYIKNDLVWPLLLGMLIVYRYRLEVAIRS